MVNRSILKQSFEKEWETWSWAPVNTVVEFWVPKNAESYLTSWEILKKCSDPRNYFITTSRMCENLLALSGLMKGCCECGDEPSVFKMQGACWRGGLPSGFHDWLIHRVPYLKKYLQIAWNKFFISVFLILYKKINNNRWVSNKLTDFYYKRIISKCHPVFVTAISFHWL
jgi:hypothetical protein